jgi:hypothetical protein
MDEGISRLHSRPAQNGHFQRVTPSASGLAWRTNLQRARWLNFSSKARR